MTKSSFLCWCDFIRNVFFFLMLYLNIKKEKVEERERVCTDEACRRRDPPLYFGGEHEGLNIPNPCVDERCPPIVLFFNMAKAVCRVTTTTAAAQDLHWEMINPETLDTGAATRYPTLLCIHFLFSASLWHFPPLFCLPSVH